MSRLLQKTDATRYAERKYGSGRKCAASKCENIDAVEEFVLSQEDVLAAEIPRIVRHFEHKHYLSVNLEIHIGNFFLIPVFSYL